MSQPTPEASPEPSTPAASPTKPTSQDSRADASRDQPQSPTPALPYPTAGAPGAPHMLPPGFAPIPMALPPGMQMPPGFAQIAYMPDPNDPSAPPQPVIMAAPGGMGMGMGMGMPMGMPMAMPYGGMFYGFPAMYGKPQNKRRQVKNACTNCQKACKKCDEERPCPRCVKYGLQDDCVDSVRKERRKGIKRGTYKKRYEMGEDGEEGEPPVPVSGPSAPAPAQPQHPPAPYPMPGYPFYPPAAPGKDGAPPQGWMQPYFMPMPPGGAENAEGSTSASATTPANAAAMAAHPYFQYYGQHYPYAMPGYPPDPNAAAASSPSKKSSASPPKQRSPADDDEDESSGEGARERTKTESP